MEKEPETSVPSWSLRSGGQKTPGTLTSAARDSVVEEMKPVGQGRGTTLGGREGPCGMRKELASQHRGKSSRGAFLLPQVPLTQAPGPGKQARRVKPAFIIQVLRAGTGGQRTLRWKDPGSVCPGLLWPGAESGSPAFWEMPSPPLPHTRPYSLRPSQTPG